MNTLTTSRVTTRTALLVIRAVIVSLGFAGQMLYAEGVQGKDKLPAVTNIGFMENPSKELRDKFPMCDAFLRVDWIDRKKGAGFSEVDLYKNGAKYRHGVMFLAYLGESAAVFLPIESDRRSEKLKHLESIIHRGKMVFEDNAWEIQAVRSDGGIDTWDFEDDDSLDISAVPGLSLAPHSLNVCIPYPDGLRMFLVESRRLLETYSNREVTKKASLVRKWIPNLYSLDDAKLMDINSDGTEDYFEGTYFIYSRDGRYFYMPIRETNGGFELTSPTSKRSCQLRAQGREGHYITTDGANFYLNNNCNLTTLTK